MTRLGELLVVVFLALVFAQEDDRMVWEAHTSCTIPNESVKGVCVEPQNCPAFQNITAGYQLSEIGRLSFIRALQCWFENRSLICCPRSGDYVHPELSLNAMRRDRNATLSRRARFGGDIGQCGLPSENYRVTGTMAEIDDFPWAAMLLYRDNYQGCDGVLISRKFVLTAAHCLTGDSYDRFGPLEYVRLGEYDTLRDPDCVAMGDMMGCNEDMIDARVQSIKVHPGYVPNSAQQYHDIGMIELDQVVLFTYYLSPICLPEARFRSVLEMRQTYSVCGWGKTTFFNYEFFTKSPIKMMASLPYVMPKVCEDIYRAENLSLSPGQLCAGGQRGHDSCVGDTGSPLMLYDKQRSSWVLKGITSRSLVNCSKANKPGIYTDVKQYLPWIKENTRL